jgi:hypothetical protein
LAALAGLLLLLLLLQLAGDAAATSSSIGLGTKMWFGYRCYLPGCNQCASGNPYKCLECNTGGGYVALSDGTCGAWGDVRAVSHRPAPQLGSNVARTLLQLLQLQQAT